MTLQTWLAQWTHKSKDVESRVNTALAFLRKHYRDNDGKILSEIRCIDFSRPVRQPSLHRGDILVGVKDPRVSPYRAAYFTRSGYPAQRLGVAAEGNLRTNPKILPKTLYRYEVMVPIPEGEVLESICAPAADTWSIQGRQVLVAGGGLQYLIPSMNRYLRFVERPG
jgi:hypothetical protein